MKNIETHGALRWGPVERKLQISYSPPPPKFAVVAEDSPVSLGSHAPGSEMGVPSSRHPICTPKKSANSTSKNFIAVHKRNVRFCAGAISDGRPYRDSDPLVSQINWEWQTWVHFPTCRFHGPDLAARAPHPWGYTEIPEASVKLPGSRPSALSRLRPPIMRSRRATTELPGHGGKPFAHPARVTGHADGLVQG